MHSVIYLLIRSPFIAILALENSVETFVTQVATKLLKGHSIPNTVSMRTAVDLAQLAVLFFVVDEGLMVVDHIFLF